MSDFDPNAVNRGTTTPGTNNGSFKEKGYSSPGAGAQLNVGTKGPDVIEGLHMDSDYGLEVHELLGDRRFVYLDNDRGGLDPYRRFDCLELSPSDQAGRIDVSARVDVGDDLLRSTCSVYGPGHGDEDSWDEDEQAALEFLGEHQADIERVLAEDYGASLDNGMDQWDSQTICIDRTVPLDHQLGETVDAVTDDRAQGLHEMMQTGDYAHLLAEAEKHAKDRETTKDLGGRVLDHLTNTVGNDVAQRARYATVATVWSEDPQNPAKSIPAYRVTAFDSHAKQLAYPVTLPVRDGLAMKRHRFPSDMTVPESDPNEPQLLNSAQNANSVLDLDKVGGNVWGRAKA